MKLGYVFAPLMLAAALSACSGGAITPAASTAGAGQVPNAHPFSPRTGTLNYRRVCDGPVRPGFARCDALLRTDVGGIPGGYHGLFGRFATAADLRVNPAAAATTPPGYSPVQLQTAYGIYGTGSASAQTIALVEAGDYPNAAADMAQYRAQYGLQACTVASGCFKVVSETGSTTALPTPWPAWSTETALDIDMASAICPTCNILVVEANVTKVTIGSAYVLEPATQDLAAAENEAAALHATVISNSYGAAESATVDASNAAYSHAGIVITASAGDDGYQAGPQAPCVFSTVVCTGGTTLTLGSTGRRSNEVVWNSNNGSATGSGCSVYVAKPSWQTDTGCKTRTESDVSFDADPRTGVAVYDSTVGSCNTTNTPCGWIELGGTSVAAPAIAAMFARQGNEASMGPSAAARFWQNSQYLYPVTGGNNLDPTSVNGKDPGCGPVPKAYLCTAGTGVDGVYSGPAGWGTPNGILPF